MAFPPLEMHLGARSRLTVLPLIPACTAPTPGCRGVVVSTGPSTTGGRGLRDADLVHHDEADRPQDPMKTAAAASWAQAWVRQVFRVTNAKVGDARNNATCMKQQ